MDANQLLKRVSAALAQSDLFGARGLLDELLALTPGDRDARHLAARLCRAQGDNQAAIAHYKLCLECDPGDEVAQFGLSVFGVMPKPDRVPDSILNHVFDRNAALYEENMASLCYRTPELLSEFLRNLPCSPTQAVTLDLGCGTGLNGFYLKPMSQRIVGVDISPQMLKLAESKGVYDLLVASEITAYLKDAEERFDLIAATNVLMYFGALDPVWAGMARLLKPNGLIALDLEKSDSDMSDGFCLETVGGRFKHKLSYVFATLAEFGLHPLVIEESIMRHEQGEPVPGLFVVAQKS